MFTVLIPTEFIFFPDPNAIITCDEVCGEKEEPVCGSDDVTYKNLCYLHRATCDNPEKEIQLLAKGKCTPGTLGIQIRSCPVQWGPKYRPFKYRIHANPCCLVVSGSVRICSIYQNIA